jgi:hypothetical protein
MSRPDLEKHICNPLMTGDIPHPEVTRPRLALKSGVDDWGSKEHNIRMTWWPITEPFEMISEPHAHDFDQFVLFVGGDITDMMELGGEVEFWLGDSPDKMEKFTFTKAAFIHVPPGLYHSPLNFKRIDDPSKPILFHDMFFANEYSRK